MGSCYVCDRQATSRHASIPYCETHAPIVPEVGWFNAAPTPPSAPARCTGRKPPGVNYKLCAFRVDPCKACGCTSEACVC
jgi:hypothetical protein